MSIEIGKVSTQRAEKRGWLVGQFFPEDSDFHDDNVEIYFKKLAKGDISDRLHKHPQGNEYLVVISGKLIYQLGEDEITLENGDYVAVPGDTPDKIIEVIEDTEILGVRYPSIPNNKVFLEE